MRAVGLWGFALVSAVLGLLSAGCSTQAFCFADCGGGGGTATGSRTTTSGEDTFTTISENPTTSGTTTTTTTSGSGTGSGGCVTSNGGVERCDHADNDCDGATDEGVDYGSPRSCGTCENNCYERALNCKPTSIACEASGSPGSVAGTCRCDACDEGYFDLDGDKLVCEYPCVKTATDDKSCDGRDNDCDGQRDEDVDPCTSLTDCGTCGRRCGATHGVAECAHEGAGACDASNTQCRVKSCDCNGPGECYWDADKSYATGCEYKCDVSNGGVEVCDGLDNDCDGKSDEAEELTGDVRLGVLCYGGTLGECAKVAHAGATQCQGGQVVCGGTGLLHPDEQAETCNGLDDDCDGVPDDGALEAGVLCGQNNRFPCNYGLTHCAGGQLTCVGSNEPKPETCNGLDDDCDGVIDDGTSDSGGACGVGGLLPCKLGVLTCQNGSISCVGAVEPSAETCNGADDDCNGQTDDNVPGAGGSCGSSGQYPCSRGALKCEGGVMACVGAVEPQSESCNGLDDDCDGVTDDGVAGVGVSCGSSERFPCRKGLTECKAGVLGCAGSIEPQPETCNGVDDDCDGTVDDAVVDVGVSCGVGGSLPCKLGTTACEAGKVVCRGSKDPSPELCNGVDDDCDGVTDDSPGGIGESCGASSTLPCKRGTTQCVGGQLLCNGAVEPKPETCNGVDDDCDGVTDDSPSDVGGTCGSSNVAPCAYGRKVCQGGAIVCVGALAPKTETCNGVDDDCDGAIDKAGSQAPSDSVGTCGQTPGAPAGATSPCRAGTKACVGGVVTCQGSVGPTGSVDGCGVDANCDGALTNQPDKQTDPRNCGSCGNDCAASAVHANFTCVAGACTFQGCATGYYDLNGDKRCEYPCVFVSAQELCNGNDDDCDGQTDEGVLAPSPAQVCGVSPTATRTECSAPAVTVACTGGQWRCTFPAGVCSPTCKDAAEVCDGLDNNCNGVLNENVPNYGKPCASDDAHPSSGDGACRTTGTYVCNGGTALRCSATKADCASLPGGCEERCDGIDNDCDGATDEPYSSKGTSAAYFVKPAVTKVSSGAYMYSYEASRPTASAVSPGNGSGYFCARATASDPASCLDAANPACNDASIACAPSGVAVDKVRACSVPGRVPWSNVTPIEAEQTCKAVGGRLCTSDDWQTACVAGSACKWGYAPRGSACTSAAVAGSKYCNLGASYDFDPLSAGLQQGLLPTGSGALAQCWSDFSGLFGNSTSTERVYDLTGNLRELTKLPSATPQSSYYRLMGGAYSTASEAGAACDFTFYTVDSSFQLFDLGFRCCFSVDPTL